MIEVTCFGGEKNSFLQRYIDRLSQMKIAKWRRLPVKQLPQNRGAVLLPEEKAFLKSHQNFVCLDVDGQKMNSKEFSDWLFRRSNRHFVVGPAIGLHSDFKKEAEELISLSSLTLTHTLAQMVLAESLYRAACIRSNHPFAK